MYPLIVFRGCCNKCVDITFYTSRLFHMNDEPYLIFETFRRQTVQQHLSDFHKEIVSGPLCILIYRHWRCYFSFLNFLMRSRNSASRLRSCSCCSATYFLKVPGGWLQTSSMVLGFIKEWSGTGVLPPVSHRPKRCGFLSSSCPTWLKDLHTVILLLWDRNWWRYGVTLPVLRIASASCYFYHYIPKTVLLADFHGVFSKVIDD